VRRRQTILLLLVGLAAAGAWSAAYAIGALRQPEFATVDVRFALRGARPAPRDIALVEIDARTLQELRRRFPFERRYHARVIDRLRRAGARVIAYDIQFTQPTDPDNDNALIEAVARGRPVVLAATEVDDRGQTNVLGGGELLSEIGARPGHVAFRLDPGGVFRRVPFAIERLKSFAVTAVEVAERRSLRWADIGGHDAWIDYPGPAGTIPTYSFVDVLRNRVAPERLRGKIVVVGASVPTLPDLHPTSATGHELMTGSEILADAIDTVRRGAPLRSARARTDVLIIVALALLGPLLALRLAPLRATLVSLAGGALYLGATQLAFEHGRILAVTYPTGAVLTAAAGGLAVHYLGATVERERTRSLFARFVPEQVVSEVLQRTDKDLRLGGVRRESTVLFSDLRGFTAWAEQRAPDEVIAVLNRYLAQMSDAIMDHGGTLVAYMGDGIMAVFGAPLEQPDHADRALAAAREMLEVRLPDFNAWLRATRLGGGFRMGVGLNSGPVMSGNVGSTRRVEYTAVGDTTNTAARLESLTKGTPYQLLLADSTRALLHAPTPDLKSVAELEMRGRQARVRAWTVASTMGQAALGAPAATAPPPLADATG
jgi:adenylate cyclase